MSKSLMRSGAIVSLMTLVSRVLGLVRDVVLANLMGAGAAADVYYFANKIPNFLRRLFVEGAFAQSFIPVLTEVNKDDDKEVLRHFLARVAGTLGAIVTVVTILGVIGSGVLAAIFGPGWFIDHLNGHPDGVKFELASTLLKITFPYLFFITLAGLAGATLNALNRFAVAAFTPVLLNVCIISVAIWWAPDSPQPAVALAWGVFIGGLVQLLFQLPFLYRARLLVKPTWGWQDPHVSKIRKLMLPALFGVSVGQINLLLDTVIASFLITGSVSWLYYSDRLLEFPLGLFGIAIATVILPTLSRNHVAQKAGDFAGNLDWGIRMVLLLGIPAAAGLFVLAEPILLLIFQRGAFTELDAAMASYSLMAYVCGLVSFMLVKVLAPGFFSRQDTKTPVKIGIWCMASNMLFNLILVWPFGYIGLAMATTLSASMNAALLYRYLRRDGVYQLSTRTKGFALRVLAAAGLMAAVILWGRGEMATWHQWDLLGRGLAVGQWIGIGLLVFVLGLGLFGVRPGDLKGHVTGAQTGA